MTIILIILLVILLFGGGFWGYRAYGPNAGFGWFGIVLLIVLVLYLTGNLRGL